MNEEKNFLDNLFDNVGEKLQSLAKILFFLAVIGFIILAIIMFVQAGDSYFGEDTYITVGFVYLICGPIASLISAWFLYGFGEIVSLANNLKKKISCKEPSTDSTKDNVQESINSQHFRCPTCNGNVTFGESTCKNCGQQFNWENM